MSPKELKQHYDTIIEQLKKTPQLLKDKRWRLENLYVISLKKGKKAIFKLNRAQADFLSKMRNRNIILKSRQLGFTTLITLWILDEILFSKNKSGIAIAHIKDGMTDIFNNKAKFAIMNMPEELRNMFNFKQNSKTKLEINFADGSSSTFSVALTGRSGTYQYVHISEYAKLSKQFPQRAEEVIMGTLPAVPMDDGYVFMESTAEGAAGNFYDTYMEAIKNAGKGIQGLFKVEFFPHFYNWTWDEMQLNDIKEEDIIPVDAMERNNDIDWIEYQKLHNLSEREMTYYYRCWVALKKNLERLNQEYPTTVEEAFISSGKPYFDARKVIECLSKTKQPEYFDVAAMKIQEVHMGPLLVWERPKPNRTYVVGGDTAEGLASGDASTLSVIDVETREVCAIFKDQSPPDEFYEVAMAVGKWYNNALLAIEVNKDGLWVNHELVRNGYENVYYRQKLDDVTKQMGKIFGWRTDRATRDSMLTELRSVFNERDFFQGPLLEEMLSFVRNSRGKPEAILGKHDDIVVATAIAYMVRKIWYVENFKPIQSQMKPTSKMDLIFGRVA